LRDAVRLNDVRQSFGVVHAVDRLSLTIPAGQTVALLGPNGAGKSTTIGMLLGPAAADRGDVELFGGPARACRSCRSGCAMLQDAGFVPDATVRELIELARGHRRPVRAPRHPARRRVGAAGTGDGAG
jgi:ABC-2 type transport system ATP-binding protein